MFYEEVSVVRFDAVVLQDYLLSVKNTFLPSCIVNNRKIKFRESRIYIHIYTFVFTILIGFIYIHIYKFILIF